MLTQETLEKISPIIGGKKYLFPLPTLSPLERQRKRTMRRNERSLHTRTCDFSGKKLLSVYGSDVSFPVYHKDLRWSDERDSLSYGKNLNLEESFLSQWYALFQQVPKPNLSADNNENCEWVNVLGWCKDCYLCFSGDYNESCLYCAYLDYSEHCVDCTMLHHCQWCYECFNIQESYQCLWSQHLRACRDCYHCFDCEGCSNCIGCVGLQNVSYHVYNQQVTKQEYETIVDQKQYINNQKYTALRAGYEPKLIRQCERVQGAFLDNCFDCTNCYHLTNSRNCSNVERGYDSEDVYDAFGSFACKRCYEISSVGVTGHSCFMSMYCWRDVINLFYCDHCFSCQDCFGCIGLRNKQYCILNKQYTKEEYEQKIQKIIQKMQKDEEWGAFFPGEWSPFAYNETKAHELFPLTKEEVIGHGRQWFDKEEQSAIPGAIQCTKSGKYFQYQQKELELYKYWGIYPPILHPEVRYQERWKYRSYKQKASNF